jgi:UDP-glucose 4-epimerase
VDNLSTGWSEAVKFGPFEEVDLLDRTKLDQVFKLYQPHAVMHFAAFSQVGESVDDPVKYWHNNVMGSLSLFQACASYCQIWCLRFVCHAAIWSGFVASIPFLNVMPVMTLAR